MPDWRLLADDDNIDNKLKKKIKRSRIVNNYGVPQGAHLGQNPELLSPTV